MTDVSAAPADAAPAPMTDETGLTAHPRACPRCGARHFTDVGIGRAPWVIGSCGDCGFVYLTAAASYDDLSELYSWDKAVELETKRRKKEQPVVQWLDHHTRWRLHLFARPETRNFLADLLPEGGKVVDLGCGDGRQGLALPERFTPYGVEISKSLAEAANANFQTRGGACVHAPSIEGLDSFAAGTFDGAMLNSYLEHETNPKGVLAAVRRALKPGGVAVVKVPNYGSWNAKVMGKGWCGVRLPDHVNYFTPQSLRDMAADVGLSTRFPHLTNLPTNDNFWAFLEVSR